VQGFGNVFVVLNDQNAFVHNEQCLCLKLPHTVAFRLSPRSQRM
jgi:hypothetical protein